MYNIDFELCALGILLLVLLHSHIGSTLHTFCNRLFLAFTICGLANILLDILSTVMIYAHEDYPLLLLWLVLTVLYLLQLAMPYLLYLYVLSLHNGLRRRRRLPLLAASAPFFCMAAIVLSNPAQRLLFWFDAGGVYSRGPLYLAMYMHAAFYMTLVLLDTLIYRRCIAKRYIAVIWEFVLLAYGLVLVQVFFHDILLSGVGIAAALIVMLLTVNNPRDHIDTLTGLFGMNALQDALLECRRSDSGCVYPIVVALDRLKRINLAFGVESCNAMLQHYAQQFTQLVGPENAFRFLGDQFVLLCRSPRSYANTWLALEKLFDTPYTIRSTDIHLSVCICGIPHPETCSSPRELIDLIDYLVGQAKKSGAGSRLIATDALIRDYHRHKEIEAYLYTAVQEDLFEVYYQPVYDTIADTYVSAEALVRLRHPTYGMLSPAEFIPIAEGNGEIGRVEHAILIRVCRFLQANPGLRTKLRSIKFNLSPASFLNAQLSERLLDVIRSCGLDPHFFQFEITETVATVYDSELNEWAQAMRDAGAGLCLDDFGSGYANLEAVTRLPFDVVKLDRSLLLSAKQSSRSAIFYTHIAAAMQGLGCDVVAEGAETAQDIAFLRSRGVRYVQGFYYARPMPEQQLLETLGLRSAVQHVSDKI